MPRIKASTDLSQDIRSVFYSEEMIFEAAFEAAPRDVRKALSKPMASKTSLRCGRRVKAPTPRGCASRRRRTSAVAHAKNGQAPKLRAFRPKGEKKSPRGAMAADQDGDGAGAGRPVHKLKSSVFDPLGPELLGLVYSLPAGLGFAPFDGCSCGLCRFLAKPRHHAATVMITRHHRLAASVAVLRPDIHVFAFADNVEFALATSRLAAIAADIERLKVERRDETVEETLAVLEQAAVAHMPTRGAMQ